MSDTKYSIHFFSESVKYSLPHPQKIRKWILETIECEGKKSGEVNFIFCEDAYLLQMNQLYLNHNTLTDIITFDYSAKTKISGDIFISIERVQENAKKFKVDFEQELHRVMIHGVLHLIGFQDKTTIQKTKMRKKENEYLSLLQ